MSNHHAKSPLTGVLLITHSAVGKALLDTARAMFGSSPKAVIELLPVALDADVDAISAKANQLATQLDHGNGVLVLTDAYGSTPNNVGRKLLNSHNASVLAGVNLPMLIRVFNYPDLPHAELAKKALEAGHEGIMQC